MKKRLLLVPIISLSISVFTMTSCEKKETITDEKEIINIVDTTANNMSELTKFTLTTFEYNTPDNDYQETRKLVDHELYDSEYYVCVSGLSTSLNDQGATNSDSYTRKGAIYADKWVAQYYIINSSTLYYFQKNTQKTITARLVFDASWKINFRLILNDRGLKKELAGFKVGTNYEFTCKLSSSYVNETEQNIKIEDGRITEVNTLYRKYNSDGSETINKKETMEFKYNTTKERDKYAKYMESGLLSSATLVGTIGETTDDIYNQSECSSTSGVSAHNNDKITLYFAVNSFSSIDGSSPFIKPVFQITPHYLASLNDDELSNGEPYSLTLDPSLCILGEGVTYGDGRFISNNSIRMELSVSASFSGGVFSNLEYVATFASPAVQALEG